MQFAKNSFFLYILHFGNYLYPFFLTPILAKSLGVAEFGSFSYLLSIAQIAILVIDYGFNYAGIAQVAQKRHCKRLLSETFVTIMGAKVLILGLVLLLFAFSIIQYGNKVGSLFWFLPFVIGSAMTPQWYFMGMERSSTLALFTVAPKLLGVPVIILVLRENANLEMAALLMGLPVAVSAVSLNCIIWRSSAIAWHWPRFAVLRAHMKDGWYIFISQVSTVLYTTLNPILLYLLFDAKAVSYFVVADKLRMACQSLISPIMQSANAHCSRIAINDIMLANQFARKTVLSVAALGMLAAIILSLLSSIIVSIMFGVAFQEAAPILSQLSFIIPIVAVGSSVGLLLIIPNGGGAVFARTVVIAGVLNVVLLFSLSPFLHLYAAVWSIALVESFIAIVFLCFLKTRIKL